MNVKILAALFMRTINTKFLTLLHVVSKIGPSDFGCWWDIKYSENNEDSAEGRVAPAKAKVIEPIMTQALLAQNYKVT